MRSCKAFQMPFPPALLCASLQSTAFACPTSSLERGSLQKDMWKALKNPKIPLRVQGKDANNIHPCRKIFEKLKKTPKKLSEYKEKMGTAFTSWRNTISPSYLALRSELETEGVVHWAYSASSTAWLTQTGESSPAKRVTWGSGWNWKDKRWENHCSSKKWLSGQHFLENVQRIKKSNFVNVQLRQNTAVKVLLSGRLFLALPVSWKIQRTLFDKTEHFSQRGWIMASMT